MKIGDASADGAATGFQLLDFRWLEPLAHDLQRIGVRLEHLGHTRPQLLDVQRAPDADPFHRRSGVAELVADARKLGRELRIATDEIRIAD